MAGEDSWIRSSAAWGLSGLWGLLVTVLYFAPVSCSLGGVDVWHFLLGATVALLVGHALPIGILALYRDGPSRDDERDRGMWTGFIERTIFAVIVVRSLDWISLAGAIGWISVKVAVNWGPRVVEAQQEGEEEAKEARKKAMSALLASLVSISVGVIGGLIIRASLP